MLVVQSARAHLDFVCDGSGKQTLQFLLIVFSAVVNGEDSVNLVVSERVVKSQYKFLLLFIFFGFIHEEEIWGAHSTVGASALYFMFSLLFFWFSEDFLQGDVYFIDSRQQKLRGLVIIGQQEIG